MLVPVTVSAVVLETPPNVAVMVVVPGFAPAASPFEPDVLLIVAALVLDDAQVTEVVIFCVVPSEYVPVAVNC